RERATLVDASHRSQQAERHRRARHLAARGSSASTVSHRKKRSAGDAAGVVPEDSSKLQAGGLPEEPEDGGSDPASPPAAPSPPAATMPLAATLPLAAVAPQPAATAAAPTALLVATRKARTPGEPSEPGALADDTEEAGSSAAGEAACSELRALLLTLDGSKERIEATSESFQRLSEKRTIAVGVGCWREQVTVSLPDQGLWLLYFANEVMQNSLKRAALGDTERATVPLFWRGIPVLVNLACRDRNSRRCAAVLDLLHVWKERRVYPSDLEKKLDALTKKVAVWKASEQLAAVRESPRASPVIRPLSQIPAMGLGSSAQGAGSQAASDMLPPLPLPPRALTDSIFGLPDSAPGLSPHSSLGERVSLGDKSPGEALPDCTIGLPVRTPRAVTVVKQNASTSVSASESPFGDDWNEEMDVTEMQPVIYNLK
ncbi:hypothetical protein T492DRAFT_490314, partial [Pavlovales sp. CCMP2436]